RCFSKLRTAKSKAAGGVLTAKQAPHRPGTAPALGLRAERGSRHGTADQPRVGERTMSFPSWLRNLRSPLTPRLGRRLPARPGFKRAPTHRPNLEVLEGRLTPSFSPATSFPVGPNPQAVVTADFNNDGRLDLATANAGGDTVSVLLGDGRGGFGAAKYSAATGPRSMAVADFNTDGHLDRGTPTDQ